MAQITFRHSTELDVALRQEASRRGVTRSALVRAAIEQHLVEPPARRRFGAAGIERSGHADISERAEELLAF